MPRTVVSAGGVATLVVSILCASWAPGETPSVPALDFNRDIRPILSNRCFRCHGPDEKQRQGGGESGLRLDTPEGIASDLGGRVAVVPGEPERSALVARITSHDASEIMPPPDAGPGLDAAEIALLERWVREGAPYDIHWAYRVPRRPPLPGLESEQEKAWAKGPLDHFVLERLRREGIVPQAEADRHALVRRVALDVTGLPPGQDDIDQFVADASADAYERMVDRFLAKDGYGEHWARMWLDAARYADSSGYADDPPRTIWLYRDYVIDAFNRNLPFDRFTIEQLAGDMVPAASSEQLIATAFHRNTLTNNEGGTNDEEFRNVAVVDRVNTTYAVWMGTTMACAQCHSHKYDPITQRDYFQSFAIFNNTEDADRGDESPLHEVWTDEQLQRRAALDEQIAADARTRDTSTPELDAAREAWERRLPSQPAWSAPDVTAARSEAGVTMTIDPEARTVRSAAGAGKDTFHVDLDLDGVRADGTTRLAAIQLETFADDALPNRGPGWNNGNFILTELRATLLLPAEASPAAHSVPGASPGAADVLPLADAAVVAGDGSSQGRETSGDGTTSDMAGGTDGGRVITFAAAVADFQQGDYVAANLAAKPIDPAKGWGVGGGAGGDHRVTLIAAEPVDIPEGSRLRVSLIHQSPHTQHVIGRFRLSVTGDATAREWADIRRDVRAILQTPEPDRTDAQRAAVAAFHRSIAPELAEVRARLDAARAERAALTPATTVPILRERGQDRRRVTRLQHRGNYLDLGEEVGPGVPGALNADGRQVRDRLELAKWLVSEGNPLTARVTVNRHWEQLFGTGLVASTEEFGSQGDPPSHPELLDWLAVEFVESGWDLKRLLRTMLTSATYRQSSVVSHDALGSDPDNRLLARGPRFRLPAETIRDQALAVAGLLSPTMHGPPVKPPQPSLGLSAAFGSSTDWVTSPGDDRYRRGIYTMWRRSNPYPSIGAFDAPNREVCTLRRVRTNTPLQALVTLNDPVYIEAAQALGRTMRKAADTDDGRIEYGLKAALCRPIRPDEIEVLKKLYVETEAIFASQPEAAMTMATEPLGPLPEGLEPTDMAAWTVVANAILNLDEFLMRR